MHTEADSSKFAAWIPIGPKLKLPQSAFHYSYARSSGPGGQHVNKVATKVRLCVILDDLRKILSEETIDRLIALAGSRISNRGQLMFVASQTRSQGRNRQECLDRLRELIVQALKPVKKRKRRRISKKNLRKQLESKRKHSAIKKSRRRVRDTDF